MKYAHLFFVVFVDSSWLKIESTDRWEPNEIIDDDCRPVRDRESVALRPSCGARPRTGSSPVYNESYAPLKRTKHPICLSDNACTPGASEIYFRCVLSVNATDDN